MVEPDHHHSPRHPGLARILARADQVDIDDALSEHLAPSDMTTLLLHAFDRRSESLGCADVMRQYGQDRFVSPTEVDALILARLELAALEAAAPTFEPVALAPVVPLGAHRALGGTPQNNVVSTSRMTEVTADPTNSLALEAAARRQRLLDDDSRSRSAVHLAAAHRVTRAQRFDGPRSFAHFSLFGLVSAGRDAGNFDFENQAVRRQLLVLLNTIRTVTAAPVELRLTAFTPATDTVLVDLCDSFRSDSVLCTLDPERTHGRGYYRNICFKLLVEFADGMSEVGDGGDVWWTQNLLQSQKERLVISGLGVERLAMLATEGR